VEVGEKPNLVRDGAVLQLESLRAPPMPIQLSQLPPQDQISRHLPARDPRRPPQRRPIQRTRKRVCISEAQHRRDPATGVFECETRAFHLVLLDFAAS
jgi:hypothetical protein